ncbi:Tkp3 protein [Vanderwaltozyma polyspora DSM 70294]|uniref:Tkp3 protein n=1 Tax=Vanderwaltozyma polyspora (strain ATCC 22028 / DSM 70294 / BCRC 21397 / CBS 2163 / NBRC 10782 / NRRL Y-8283 / UCD 57-17) TaxID=436907 RepID=A7TTB4_VANPO|nr:Tkp3 protein [Vanderwaltozyma polyspora DSM 70294]EDO14496.1 Tkp3 protein [Vanderwaltozyma polyspora DSM 70294]
MRSHIVKEEEDIKNLGETGKNFEKRFNIDEAELKRFEESVEKKLFQMDEKINSKETNNSGSKYPSPNEILARVGKHFPHLIIYGSHGLLTNCNKNYSDVSLPNSNDITLKEEHLDDPGRILMNIQGSLVGKHIRFQDWEEVLYSCCQDDVRSYLTDQRGLIVDWTTAIFKLFQTFDFNAKTHQCLREISQFYPKAGDVARDYFVKLIRKGKAVKGASTLAIVSTKIHDILMTENSPIPGPNLNEIHNFIDLHNYVTTNIPIWFVLQGNYGKSNSAPLFAIQRSQSTSFSASHRKPKVSTATFYCSNCSCPKCSGTIKPYMKRGFCTKCKCEKCSSRIRRYKKSNIADMKVNVLETANHNVSTDDDDETDDSEFVFDDEGTYSLESLSNLDDNIEPTSVFEVNSLDARHP